MMIQTIVLNSKTNRKLITELGNAVTKSNSLEKELSMLKIIPKNKKLSHPTRKSSALLLALFSSLKNDSIETGDIFYIFIIDIYIGGLYYILYFSKYFFDILELISLGVWPDLIQVTIELGYQHPTTIDSWLKFELGKPPGSSNDNDDMAALEKLEFNYLEDFQEDLKNIEKQGDDINDLKKPIDRLHESAEIAEGILFSDESKQKAAQDDKKKITPSLAEKEADMVTMMDRMNHIVLAVKV